MESMDTGFRGGGTRTVTDTLSIDVDVPLFSQASSMDISPALPEPITNKENVEEYSDPDEEEPPVPIASDGQKFTNRKRQDIRNFEVWVSQAQREVTKNVKGKLKTRNVQLTSVATIVASNHQVGEKIIQKPREYQLELFEKAKQKNTIIVLDTGSGKTLISALLLRHILDQELEDRENGKPPKVAFFLVDKVALCYQQYEVLSRNLEHPVTKLFGDKNVPIGSTEFWKDLFMNNMVVVCTAQILLDSLSSGFIRMERINLLIFDEAHHTKKNHPYARIIKDFYLRTEKPEQPRILGMTASPVDAKTTEVGAVAARLESMLASEIATVSDETLAQQHASRKLVEIKEEYRRLDPPDVSCTDLWRDINQRIWANPVFRIHLNNSKEASSTLGPWCADRYWQFVVTEREILKLMARTEADAASRAMTVQQGDMAVAAIKEVRKLVEDHEFRLPTARGANFSAMATQQGGVMVYRNDMSSKVETLREVLENEFRNMGTERAIVFVEKRFSAFLLSDVFQQETFSIPGVNTGFMTGFQSTSNDVSTMTFREQILALRKFREGSINCLFATPVAEEGLDIPQCDLIIRFDLFNSMIQYIQSKGRARQANSRFITMVEEGNQRDLAKLAGATRDSNALRQFCAALPEDRKLNEVTSSALAAAEHEMIGQKIYTIEETGARLTFRSSLEVLHKFVTSCVSQENKFATPDFIVSTIGRKFKAEIIFPDGCPIKVTVGHPQRSKILARCSAAFEACVRLIEDGFIDKNFQSTLQKRLPAMRNARLAVSPNKKSKYAMKMKPNLWSQLGPANELFPTLIRVDKDTIGGRSIMPMLLLTREPLPSLPDIKLFLSNDTCCAASLNAGSKVMKMSDEEVELLKNFTLKLFLDVFSKEYEAIPEEIPYFFSPVLMDDEDKSSEGLEIDWKLLKFIKEKPFLDAMNREHDFYDSRFVMDPLDGGRKFVILGVNQALKPSDPTPSYAPLPKSRAYRSVAQVIKEYSNSLFPGPRKKAVWDENQVVVDAEILSLGRNFLDDGLLNENHLPGRCALILEPLKVSPIPVHVISMALLLPAIMHRTESTLIALEACHSLDLNLQPALALEAVTKDSENTDENESEQINFQRGMGQNYERLEFLGDTFLKMATTIALYTTIPDRTEYEYHVHRMCLINNKNLFNHMVDRHLEESIRTKAFSRRAWYPNMKLVKGKALKVDVQHALSDKTIADVAEALIGAAYLSSGKEGDVDMAVTAVTKMVNDDRHEFTKFEDYFKAYEMPRWRSIRPTAAQKNVVTQMEKILGYRFNSPVLLRSAFKHPSYPYESVPNYECLEFLGDGLLDMVIVDYLFRNFPHADPQWFTEHKMAMASNHFLGYLCIKLGLQKYLLLTSSAHLSQISTYISDVESIEEEARIDGGELPADFWRQTPEGAKALADIVEALVGALFVDSSYSFEVVRNFFNKFFQPYFGNMNLYDNFQRNHPLTHLGNVIQQEFACQHWRVLNHNVPAGREGGIDAVTETEVVAGLLIHGNVVADHTAASRRYAELGVAKRALEKFKEMSKTAWRTEYGCTCGEGGGA